MFRELTPVVFVSPQIGLAEIAAAKDMGVTLIINNRPDGEEPSAPQGDEIEAAAKAAGMAYIAIPVTHAGFAEWQLTAMADALAACEGKTLAYCRSGTRSTLLWALAQAKAGMHPAEIAERAAVAGYDVAPISMMIDTLAAQAKG
jgi:uncharacterized protein (TIGR01244 family)